MYNFYKGVKIKKRKSIGKYKSWDEERCGNVREIRLEGKKKLLFSRIKQLKLPHLEA